MVGPMDFTTNDEIGVLIAGHEYPPIILCPWHHPYYQRLFEQDAGMEKAMDLYMWSLHVTEREHVHPAIWQAADRLESEHGIVCRNFRKRDLQQEVTRFLEVYNASWERNWGFVPLTEEEVRHYAKDLKPVFDENWAMVAEKRDTGEVVGAALTLPDFNQVLAKLNGRLLPFGWVTALRGEKQDRRGARVRAGGQARLPAHRGRGALLPDAFRRCGTHTAEGRRDGLDPGDQQADEPRDGRHGRRDQAPVSGIRAVAIGAASAAGAPRLVPGVTAIALCLQPCLSLQAR